MNSPSSKGISEEAEDDEISLKELVLKIREWYRYLLSKWLTIVLAGMVGGGLGLAYAWWKKPVYTAECTFVLEEDKGGGGLGQYAGLASMVGIDIGGGGGGMFQGDNIIELYKSRLMLQKTLLSEAIFAGKKQLLIDRYITFNQIKDKWKNIRSEDLNFNQAKLSIRQDSIIGEIVKAVNKNNLKVTKPDKKLSIISVKFESEDELFAKAFTDKIVQNVNQFYIETKTKKSLQNVAILQRQTDSVKRVLYSSIGGSAVAIDANPNPNRALQILQVPSRTKQIEATVAGKAYEELVKNLELSKISLRKEAPLIQVIDEPILPLKKEELKKWEGTVIGVLMGVFLSTLCLLSVLVIGKMDKG